MNETPDLNELYARYNVDDVFNRVVIIGLLNLLNHELHYEQIWETNTVETVHVPFMFDFGSSDERFAQDNYAFLGESCFGNKKITGKFDMLPRGAVRYTGSQIDNGSITNRFVKGYYLKNENGRLTSYMSFLTSIPITFNFDCEMWIDNMVTAFKIEQALRDTFYKNKTFNVLYKGMKIGCRAGFPEQHNLEKTVEYSFDADRKIKLNFSIVVEAYQPCFDETTAIEASKRIERFAYDVTLMGNKNREFELKFKDFNNDLIYPAGSNVLIEWMSHSNVSDMATIILSYIDESGEKHLIESPMFNQKSFLWHIPEGFTEYIEPTISFNADVVSSPVIKIIPDSKGRITKESFIVLEPGLFSLSDKETSVTATLSYVDDKGTLCSSELYTFKLDSRKIDVNEPVLEVDPGFVYTKNHTPRKISLMLEYPLDRSINDKIDNVLIL